jgi:hypothetical protein
VAERDRIPNKERRARAREERRRAEAAQAERKQSRGWRNGLATFAVVGVVAAVLFQAFAGGPETIEDAILLTSTEVESAREGAGCEVLADRAPLPDRSHFENSAQVDPATVYTDTRPTHSGPHTAGVHPITPAATRQIDEVSSTHNLEHGSIIVWWDPEQIDSATAGAIGTWASTLNANGFRRDASGVGIITSPFEDPGIGTGKAVAFRAWGVAMDCDTWDETVAHAFALDHFGTHGIGPERQIAPFPDGVLAYEDREVADTSEEDAPIDGLTPEEGMEELDPEDREGVVSEDEGETDGPQETEEPQETDGDEG